MTIDDLADADDVDTSIPEVDSTEDRKVGCKKATIKFARAAWRVLGPVLAPHVTAVVGVLDEVARQLPEAISNHDKRRIVIETTLARAREIGHEAYDDAKPVTIGMLEGAIRTQIERSLYLLREGVGTWTEVDDPSDEDQPIGV
jgi:hypothetical protein